MALTIDQLVNDYGSYSGTTLIGERGARATVPNKGFGSVTGVPYPNITFIVRVNGRDYASSSWLSEQQNGNPYLHQGSIPRINTRSVNSMPIGLSPFADKQDEYYAEVDAKSKLDDTDEILKFINYLLDGKDGVDPAIPTFGDYGVWDNGDPKGSLIQTIQNPGSGEEYPASPIRVFDSKSPTRSKKSWIGSYSSENDLAGVYPGLGFEPTNFDGTLAGEEAQSQSIPPIISDEPVEKTDSNGQQPKIDLSDFNFDDIIIDIPPIDLSDFDFGLGNLDPFTNNTAGFGSLQSLSGESGLASTGLQEKYDTGNYGPMQDILEKTGQWDAYNEFGNFGF
jgi:hypothetical protein